MLGGIIIRKIQVIIVSLLLFLFLPPLTHGETTEGTYFIKPLLPTNQKETISDYFDLEIKQGSEQNVQISIHNESEDDMTFLAVVEQAITNDYGVIEYVHDLKEYDPSLLYPLEEVVEVTESIKVSPGSSELIEIKITMPDVPFEGIMLGGIRVMEKSEAATASGISNVFSYVMPIKMYQAETLVPNKLEFHDVQFATQDYNNIVQVDLQNPQPELLRGLTLAAKVVDAKTEKVLYEETRTEMKLAPNSSFSFPIMMGKDKVKAGKYRLDLTATAEGLDEKWSKEFEVIAKKAAELNNDLVLNSGPNWRLYMSITCLILAVGVIAFLVYRQQQLLALTKKSKRSKNMKKRRKKTHTEKLIVLLLASSCLGFASGIVEAADNNGLSDATIVLKKKEESTSSSSQKKPIPKDTSNKNPQKKTVLPQTGSLSPSYSTIILGSGLIISATLVIGLQQKSERGQQNVK